MPALTTSFATGTLSARPAAAAGNTGRYFFATDVQVLYQSNGASWVILTQPPPAKVALAAVDSGGGIFSWVNPYSAAILVNKVIVDVTTAASGACSIDIGETAVNGTTQADNLIDGLDIHTSTGQYSTVDQAGANGKERIKVPSGAWMTGSKDSGTSSGLVGYVYIFHAFA
jgi:hypothetical protein